MSTDSNTLSPTAHPLRNPSVQAHYVRDEVVLAGGRHHELLALNATGRAIWERCDGTATLAEIIDRLALEYDATRDEIADGVRAVIADLHARGLLHFQRPGTPTSNGRAVSFFVSFYGHHVEVYIEVPDLAASFKRFTEATFSAGDGIAVGRVEAYAHDDGYRVCDDRGSEAVVPKRGDALTWMKRHFVTRLIEARPDLLWLHAGAVARDGRAVLCAGERGSGKSTLMTALYNEGWAFFSDDVLPYDPASGCVLPFPLTPVYRKGGVEVMTLEELSSLRKSRTRLDPTRIADRPTPVELIVFPSFQPDRPGALLDHPPASTVVKLAKNCFNLSDYCGDPTDTFRDLAERVPAYTVEHNADAPSIERVRPVLPA